MTLYSLEELAELTSTKLVKNYDEHISGINILSEASPVEASFLANPRYFETMKSSKAGVICVDENTDLTGTKNFLVCKDPSFSFQQIAELFLSQNNHLSSFEGIHQSAVIHKSAKIGENVIIGPNAVIDKDVEIDDNTFIGPVVYIGPKVKIGTNCIIHPNVVIREGSIIKNRVIIQPGAIIGSCGFGYTLDKDKKYKKLAQLGIVIIEDDAEIGANTTIDRARLKATIISSGTKIDNLVQIAHNVEIGSNTAIAAQTGIAGSSKVGNHVMMGGQVGVTGHVEIADFAMLASRSGVSKNLPSGKFRGSPAIPLSEYNRQKVYLRNLHKHIKRLEDKIEKLAESK